MSQRTKNVFVRGMMQDIDPISQPQGTYTDSLNGRLLFNADGSYSWENADGNSVAFTISPNYGLLVGTVGAQVIGHCAAGDELVLFLRPILDGVLRPESEIGVVSFNAFGNGTYQTIFNDGYDPNGDSLGLSEEYPIVGAKYHYETPAVRRVYWTDRNNEPRVFNIVLGKQSVSPEFVDGDYQPISSFTTYPSFYSVHNMNQNADVKAGTIEFDKHVSGSLYTGVYQYTYRLVTRDGYKTPFFPPIRRLFVTSDAVSSNWTEYEMEPVSEITTKGLRLAIDNIDTRYDKIEIAYIYGITELAAKEAAVFYSGTITSSTITADHISNNGKPLVPDEVPLFYDSINTIQTIEIKDNRMWHGGISVAPKAMIDTSGVTMQPKIRLLRDDINTQLSTVGGHYYSSILPMTNSEVAVDGTHNVKLKRRLYKRADGTDVIKESGVHGDYIAYKGTKSESVLSGYFRGETYRLAAVCLDLKGNPAFAIHLGDFTFPEQYGNSYTRKYIDANGVTQTVTSTTGSAGEYTLTDNGTASWDMAYEDSNSIITHGGKSHLKIMGLTISNIDLTDIINDISAIFIVRADRDASILHQGLLLSTLQDGANTHPLIYSSNYFDSGGLYPATATSIKDEDGDPYAYRPYVFTYECPDYMINNSVLDNVGTADRFKIVGACYMNDGDNHYGSMDSGTNSGTGTAPKNFVVKAYHTGVSNISRSIASDTWDFGAEASVAYLERFGAYADFPLFPAQFVSQTFKSNARIQDAEGLTSSTLYDSTYHGSSLVVVPEGITGNFKHLSAATTSTPTRKCCYVMVNYVNPKSNPYGGVNAVSIGNTVYYPTGYFLPITQQVKDDIEDAGTYILNGIEVWGGDCYLNFFNYQRYYGWEGGASSQLTSGALGFPVESKHNFTLRKGRTWEKVGTRDDGTTYPVGLSETNQEEFNLNSVLLYREPNFFYNGIPDGFTEVTEFPNMWKYSEVKYSGESTDNFRKFLANSYGEVDGQYGGIKGSFSLFNEIYSLQEHGFGRLRINERAAIQSGEGETLRIGSGGLLDGIQYISQIYGSQHKCSIAKSNSAAYWFDVYNRVICKFSQAGLDIISDSKGLHTFINTHIPSYKGLDAPTGTGGIFAVYDFLNNEVVFIAKGVSTHEFAVSYSEMLDAFVSRWSYLPNFVCATNGYMYSMDVDSDEANVYKHVGGAKGSFYSSVYDSYIKFSVNPHPEYSKVFDNAHIVAKGNIKTIVTQAVIDTDTTVSQTINVSADARAKNREGILNFPLRSLETSSPRMRGKYMNFKLSTNNSTNSVLRINSVETLFRLSKNN